VLGDFSRYRFLLSRLCSTKPVQSAPPIASACQIGSVRICARLELSESISAGCKMADSTPPLSMIPPYFYKNTSRPSKNAHSMICRLTKDRVNPIAIKSHPILVPYHLNPQLHQPAQFQYIFASLRATTSLVPANVFGKQ